jgi:hypothetical protein
VQVRLRNVELEEGKIGVRYEDGEEKSDGRESDGGGVGFVTVAAVFLLIAPCHHPRLVLHNLLKWEERIEQTRETTDGDKRRSEEGEEQGTIEKVSLVS